MSGPSNAQTETVWPGYVAAMACLLLSLLLVTAVLVVTISQIGNVSAAYQKAMIDKGFKSRAEVEERALSAGITDQSLTAPLDQGPAKQKPALDMARAVYDTRAAREAAKLMAEDKSLLAQVDLSYVDVRRVVINGLDLSGIDLSRQISPTDLNKIDFSKIDWKGLEPARIAQLKPFIAKEAIRYQLKLQVQTKAQKVDAVNTPKLPSAPESLPVPVPVPVSPSVTAAKVDPPLVPESLQFKFVDDAVQPTPAQKQPIVQALAAFKRQHAVIRISTTLPQDDTNLKRTAYSRLVTIRAMAIESGFAPVNVLVAIDMVPGSAVPQGEMTLWVKAHKP